ncbi:GIY-YIG nuclease family protein [Priestia filamentosa]|uniref:GIY-YIG nuclease family protein n=1 Tax=Priestia filamentosa TaxID=1402861 RepID=UPI00397C4D48
MFKKFKELLNINKTISEKEALIQNLDAVLADKQKIHQDTVEEARQSVQAETAQIKREAEQYAQNLQSNTEKRLEDLLLQQKEASEKLDIVETSYTTRQSDLKKAENKVKKVKAEVVGIHNLIEKFPDAVNYSVVENELSILEASMDKEGVLEPLVHLNLHYEDSKLLKKEMTANKREITKLLSRYESRYTTKANQTIYQLMVIGLQAELQNILHTLSYTNRDKAVDTAKELINKYLTICGNGNASILPTVTRFLSELEPLFLNAIKIEYSYYVQREKEKEEQKRIREQMRQEAEEQRQLEAEKKKIQKEEEKYANEIKKNQELLAKEQDESKIAALELRLKELERQVQQVEEKKDEIVKRANGKAGYVYVISNMGSFGENMFKVGMTRRLNPMDRVDELGDASVPFKFDVHAMIFSNDAVGLEQKMHQILDKDRVNKVNNRKEFFYGNAEKLQEIVQEIEPSAEFTLTMIAAEYRQSQSIETEEPMEEKELVYA